jgi:hypothetical protein
MFTKLYRSSLILLLLAQTADATGPVEVAKTEDPDYRETAYSVTSGSCGIAWVVRRFSARAGFGISERSRCALPLATQSPLRSALLREVIKDTDDMQGMRNYFWGRLQRGDANDEFALRLSRAAAGSEH